MGALPRVNDERLGITLPGALLEALREYAKRRGVSVAEAVRQALRVAVGEVEDAGGGGEDVPQDPSQPPSEPPQSQSGGMPSEYQRS